MDIPFFDDLPETHSIYAGNPDGINQRLGMIEAVGNCLLGFCQEKLLTLNLPITINDSFEGIHILEELLYGIAYYYLFGVVGRAHEQKENALLRKISEFVYLHNGKPVTVDDLAEYLNYSSGYLLTLVQRYTGQSTKTFIDLERINIMKELMLYSDVRIGELAHLMEFHDTKYFTRFFRKYTGETPREWLKKY